MSSIDDIGISPIPYSFSILSFNAVTQVAGNKN